MIHDEAVRFIRTQLHVFNFHISAEGAGFDELARWCFKIKGQKGEKNRMKQLILNIHPPNPDKPIQMFQIWDHLQEFCKDLATYRRIPGLKIVFPESSEGAEWATNGIVNSSFGLQEYFHKDNFHRHDIGQILLAFSHSVKNVRKPEIVFPNSVVNSAIISAEEMQEEITGVEQLMTGKWRSGNNRAHYEHLEDVISMQRSRIPYNTGLKSKAVFERMFGREATLDWQSLTDFEKDYPYMDILGPGKRPRYRVFACRDWYCGCQESYCEVSMPDAGLDDEMQEQWYEERMEYDGPCPLSRAHIYPG